MSSNCRSREQYLLSDQQWCLDTYAELDAAGVGWPVANRPVTPAQLDEVGEIFVRAGDEAGGDLRTAAKAWSQGYEAVLPYLRTGDQPAFEEGVGEEMKTQFHLANIVLTNICRW